MKKLVETINNINENTLRDFVPFSTASSIGNKLQLRSIQ